MDVDENTGTLETHYALQILRELLPTSKEYENAFSWAGNNAIKAQ
ncbi:hypothetical protein ACI6Q2_11380 [Chitinophagaceae bacterium LWZ2-11]